MTIKLEVIEENHFVVSGDEPFRVEVLTVGNHGAFAHVYRGADIDLEQEPIGSYDPTVDSTSWVWKQRAGIDDDFSPEAISQNDRDFAEAMQRINRMGVPWAIPRDSTEP